MGRDLPHPVRRAVLPCGRMSDRDSKPADVVPGAGGLTHLDEQGQARMVEVGRKAETARSARASGRIELRTDTLTRLLRGDLPKGEALAVARIAAIQAVKRTADLIPLCHPLRITGVDVAFQPDWGSGRAVPSDDPAARVALLIDVEVRAFDRTGVEMEALTAVSIAALTVYDMCKAVEREMSIGGICLAEKRGGRSGSWVRDSAAVLVPHSDSDGQASRSG